MTQGKFIKKGEVSCNGAAPAEISSTVTANENINPVDTSPAVSKDISTETLTAVRKDISTEACTSPAVRNGISTEASSVARKDIRTEACTSPAARKNISRDTSPIVCKDINSETWLPAQSSRDKNTVSISSSPVAINIQAVHDDNPLLYQAINNESNDCSEDPYLTQTRSDSAKLLSESDRLISKLNEPCSGRYSATEEEHISSTASQKSSEQTSGSKLVLLILCLANMGGGVCFSLPAPFYPREAAKKGISPSMVGLVFSSFQLSNFISFLILGRFMTKIGAKFMFCAGTFSAGYCSVLFGFLARGPGGATFLAFSLAIRAMEAVGSAAFMTAGLALACSQFPTKVASVFALLETFYAVGMMIGPSIGGILYDRGGYGLPFWVLGAGLAVLGMLTPACFPVPEDKAPEQNGSMLALLRSPLSWIGIMYNFLGSVAISFMEPVLAPHLEKYGLTTVEIGLVFIIPPSVYALSSPIYGYLCDKWSIEGPLMIVSSVAIAFGYICMGPSPLIPILPNELWMVIIGISGVGMTVACTIVPTLKCMVIAARELGFPDGLDTNGLISGLFNATYCLGGFIGPTLAGALEETVGFPWGATVVAFLFLLAFLILSLYYCSRPCLGRLKKHNYSLIDDSPD